MSTKTAPAPSLPARPGPTLLASTRVVLRQHRRALWAAGVLALGGIAVLVGCTLWAVHVTDSFEADPCSATASGLGGARCDDRIQEFGNSMSAFSTVLSYAGLALLVLPVLVGAFVAGPMIAREFENGSYKVSWTQSVSPTRWLLAKLAVPAVLLVAAVSVLSATFAWARSHQDFDHTSNWWSPEVFSAMGTAPVGRALLGLAVGALAGVLIRRTVPAMSVAVLACSAAIVVLTTQLVALWPLRTAISTKMNGLEGDYWQIDIGRITADGHRLTMETCWPDLSPEEARCVADHHATGFFIDYHPGSHFWPLQLVETGILLVVAAALAAVTFRVLRHRHG
ncbi:hypothetical protein [Streptomyces sp. NPDC058382]|uniref:hypothetical protein n=1 Tax=unclassified Streptomyces TaxID=2593676 RepID=UPI00362F0F7C